MSIKQMFNMKECIQTSKQNTCQIAQKSVESEVLYPPNGGAAITFGDVAVCARLLYMLVFDPTAITIPQF